MVKREYPESQPKYGIDVQIPVAGIGRMRSPYPKGNKWFFKDESTEKPLIPFESFRSAELPYLNGSAVTFSHGWSNFNSATDFYQVQVWGICVQNQAGYVVGDRVLLNGRRCTATITDTSIVLSVGSSGISINSKSGNRNEFSLDSSRWRLYINAFRGSIY